MPAAGISVPVCPSPNGGMRFGVDPNDVALELPLVGTFGFGAPVTASPLN